MRAACPLNSCPSIRRIRIRGTRLLGLLRIHSLFSYKYRRFDFFFGCPEVPSHVPHFIITHERPTSSPSSFPCTIIFRVCTTVLDAHEVTKPVKVLARFLVFGKRVRSPNGVRGSEAREQRHVVAVARGGPVAVQIQQQKGKKQA